MNNGILDKAQIIPFSNNKFCKIIYKNNKLILQNLLNGFIYNINSQLKLIN